MNNKYLSIKALMVFITTSSLLMTTVIKAQPEMNAYSIDEEGLGSDYSDDSNTISGNYDDNDRDPMSGYSISTYRYDYDYSTPSYYNQTGRGYHYNPPYNRYDNSGNFSSGISSYQGTSTGPGPNGGYPGAPHGTYKTRYYNKTDNQAYNSTMIDRR